MSSIAKRLLGLRIPIIRPAIHYAKPSAILIGNEPIEEQTLPRYIPQQYYPARIGEVLNKKYLVVAKLGFGASSTVWLAKDLQKWKWQAHSFVALKLLTNGMVDKSAASTELEMSRCIATANPKVEGVRYLRTVLDSFELKGPNAVHTALVYVPMRESLLTFQRRLPEAKLPSYLLRPLLEMLLAGLDYIHTECHIIHTDLKPDNILLGIESSAILQAMVDDEAKEPSPRRIEGDRAIYPSRNFGDLKIAPGLPKIADFGLAVWGNVSHAHNHSIQADLYQAPEVILKASWTYSADIWNLGVMLWDLAENTTLFNAIDCSGTTYSPEAHLYEMISLLGPPPKDLLERGDLTGKHFDTEGNLYFTHPKARTKDTLEETLPSMDADEKVLFME